MAYRDHRALITLVAVAALLTGCTAAPTLKTAPPPSPTATALPLSSLTLSSAGLADLNVGASVPNGSTLVTYGEHLCAPYGGWITDFPKSADDSSGQPLDPYDVLTDDRSKTKPITTVFVWSRQIATAAGIRVGSTQAEVAAAYPTAKQSSSYATRVYAVAGPTGTLVIEVAGHNSFAKGEWPAPELGTVVWMFAIRDGAKVASIAGNDAAGPCPASGDDPGDIDDD